MALEWNKKYSVGLNEIDDQHKELIRLINNLENIIEHFDEYNSLRRPVTNVLSALYNYTVLHFSTEEVLMNMFEYDLTDSHKESHDGFIKLIRSEHKSILHQIDSIEKETDNASIETLKLNLLNNLRKIDGFLQKWLINHILKSDFEYVEFFNKIRKKASSQGGWLSFLRN